MYKFEYLYDTFLQCPDTETGLPLAAAGQPSLLDQDQTSLLDDRSGLLDHPGPPPPLLGSSPPRGLMTSTPASPPYAADLHTAAADSEADKMRPIELEVAESVLCEAEVVETVVDTVVVSGPPLQGPPTAAASGGVGIRRPLKKVILEERQTAANTGQQRQTSANMGQQRQGQTKVYLHL